MPATLSFQGIQKYKIFVFKTFLIKRITSTNINTSCTNEIYLSQIIGHCFSGIKTLNILDYYSCCLFTNLSHESGVRMSGCNIFALRLFSINGKHGSTSKTEGDVTLFVTRFILLFTCQLFTSNKLIYFCWTVLGERCNIIMLTC